MFRSFNSCRFLTRLLLSLLGSLLLFTQPASAMVKMDAAGINQSIRYGIRQSHLGLYNLLGPNWIESSDGTLLNIYTPFMLLASRVARGGYEDPEPSEQALKKIRKRYGKTLRLFNDPRYPAQVKFAVSMYGGSDSFTRNLNARIEGFGRGKKFLLKPVKNTRQKFAAPVEGGITEDTTFEGINAYYFDYKKLLNLDEYKLIIGEPNQEPTIVIYINNDRIF